MKLDVTNGTIEVDEVDYEFVSTLSLRINGWGYAQCSAPVEYRNKLLHEIIAERSGLIVIEKVDHEDRNKLNNQRYNLRSVTHSQNLHNCSLSKRNKSGTTSIRFDICRGKWVAELMVERVRVLRKRFTLRSDAENALKKAQEEYLDISLYEDTDDLNDFCSFLGISE